MNELLSNQFELDNRLLLAGKAVECKMIHLLKPEDCAGKFVICDEADYGLDHYIVKFKEVDNKIAPIAMASLTSAKSVVFLSATYNSFQNDLLKTVFKVDTKIVFPSIVELMLA